MEKVKYVKNCECTEENWECDTGFSRQGDSTCLPIAGNIISYEPPKTCNKYYTVS